MPTPYALFDFDGTLIPGDSIVLLCHWARRNGLCSRAQFLRSALAGLGYALRLVTADKSKERALAFLRGRDGREVAALGERFARDELLPRIRPQGRAALARMRAQGAQIVLITASPAFYLEPLAPALGLAAVLGTRMEVDEQGRYTGRIAGANCRGEEKPRRLAAYLAQRGDALDAPNSCAYGDSLSDLPMLALCGHRVAVRAKRALRKALEGEDVVYEAWGDVGAEPQRPRPSRPHP